MILKSGKPARYRRVARGAAILVPLVAACGPDAPLLDTDPSGTALFEQGQAALADEDWREATEALDILLTNYPSSPYLAEARIGLGDAYYRLNRQDSLILAVDAFQSFLTYHPTHDMAAYAQYMIGMCYMKQMLTPDRDQANTRLAIEAFDMFLETYPESELIGEVRAERRTAQDRLVESELKVAKWQLEAKGNWRASSDRCLLALQSYPETALKCDLLWILAESYKEGRKWALAVKYYQQIANEHSDCQFAQEASERLEEIGSG